MLLKRLSFTLSAGWLALTVAASDNPTGLPLPFADNVIDTVSIFALQGTPIGVPSGFDVAQGLEGMPRHASVHAAGVVVADEPLDNFLPLYKQAN